MAPDILIPPSVAKHIGDKLYDKRKRAALEIEQVMKRLAAAGNDARITAIVHKIIEDYAYNPQANQRKGGLLCLAAAAVGLGEKGGPYLHLIVPPVLNSFTDQDSRVRYYSCEALYNIAKVARDDFLPFFPDVFDALFKLCADSERNVQNAAQFLDNLIKDIVAASPTFDVAGFVPTLREYMTVVNPYKRQFLVSWVAVLDSVPEADLLPVLPLLLGPLLAMVEDPTRELRLAVLKMLKDLYSEIVAVEANAAPPQVDFAAMGAILVEYAHSPDSSTTALSLSWLGGFIARAPSQLLPLAAPILAAVLPSLSHPTADIAEAAQEANRQLLAVVKESGSGSGSNATPQLLVADVLLVVASQLDSRTEATRLAALAWCETLLRCAKAEVLAHAPLLIPALLAAVTATPSSVATGAIGVLATVAENGEQFPQVVEALVAMFRAPDGGKLLAHRGAAVIRGLAARLGGGHLFCAVASVVEGEEDLPFAATFVQALNLLLLTAPEAAGLRQLLKGAFSSGSRGSGSRGSGSSDHEGERLFEGLHRCWAHSPGALLSLCLLCRAYDHAADVITCFEELPVTVEVLVQMDRLVGLLETPPFTFLRLHLLDPATYPALLRAMYGLLQVLPQSDAFRTLHARLHAAPTAALLALQPPSGARSSNDGCGTASCPTQSVTNAPTAVRFPGLLASFVLLQEKHAAAEADKHTQTSVQGHPSIMIHPQPHSATSLPTRQIFTTERDRSKPKSRAA